MSRCAISGCNNYSRKTNKCDGISYHSLPLDPETRKIWLKAINKDECKLPEQTFICSEHFEDGCIVKRPFKTMIMKGAIPTLKLPPPELRNENKVNEETVLGTVHKLIEISTMSNNMLCIKPFEVKLDDLGNDSDDEADGAIPIIENSIQSIFEQLDIILSHDRNSERSKTLMADISKAVLRFQTFLNGVSLNENKECILPDTRTQEECLDDNFSETASNNKVLEDDCNKSKDKLNTTSKDSNKKPAVQRKLTGMKSREMTDDTLSSCSEDSDALHNNSANSSSEDSNDSVYNLYPLAKTFLKANALAAQKIMAQRNPKEPQNMSVQVPKHLQNMTQQISKQIPTSQPATEDGNSVVRHTCSECDISLTSAYLLSLHALTCKGRFSRDSNLSYWAKKECPECKKKFSTKANLRRHLILHRLRDYKAKIRYDDISEGMEVESSLKSVGIDDSNAANSNVRCSNTDNAGKHLYKEDRNGTVLEDVEYKDPVVSDILNPSDDGNSINVKINVSGVRYIVPNSAETNSVNNVKCNICGEICTSKDELIGHKETKHPDGGFSYICNHCPSTFKTPHFLERHVKSQHTEVTMADGRNKYLASKTEIANAYPKNISFKVYSCSECPQIYFSLTELRNHKNVHRPNGRIRTASKTEYLRVNSRYVCKLCHKTYKTSTGLRLHNLDHMDNPPQYSCSKCPRKFKDKFYLRKHINNMHEMTSFRVCEFCGAKFATKAYLDRHLRDHRGVRDYKCDYCHKSFIHKGSLQCHIGIHTQPFVCQRCNKRFSEKRQWKRHTQEHENLFECTLCEETLVSGGELIKHGRDHHNITEEKQEKL